MSLYEAAGGAGPGVIRGYRRGQTHPGGKAAAPGPVRSGDVPAGAAGPAALPARLSPLQPDFCFIFTAGYLKKKKSLVIPPRGSFFVSSEFFFFLFF